MSVSDSQGEERPRKNRNLARRDAPPSPQVTGDEEGGAPPWTLLAMFGLALGLLVLYGIFGMH